jgi:hypothetical protein
MIDSLYYLDGSNQLSKEVRLDCRVGVHADVLAMLGLGHFRISAIAVIAATAYIGAAMAGYEHLPKSPP